MAPNYLLLSFLVLDYFKASTSIEGGFPYSDQKRYMAYLVNAYTSGNVAYMDWLCGGAIVTDSFILTSAACAQDSLYMYAIAGYDKYINAKELKTDECTSKIKKKIIFTCVPKTYQFDYERIELWANIDIALVKVDSPYNFEGTLVPGCTWVPNKIKVNFKKKYQDPGTSVLMFGWGHIHRWRDDKDATMYNEKVLRYTHSTIINKELCKQSYENVTLHPIIDAYMFCTNGTGRFDDKGVEIDDPGSSNLDNDGCKDLPHTQREECLDVIKRRRSSKTAGKEIRWDSRRNGICQNDHGGPVTTFVGSQELLLGVASVFLITRDRRCVGPFLHTSSFCNSAFISCIINSAENQTDTNAADKSRRIGEVRCPDIPPGMKLESRRISWASHSDGPAANEIDQDLLERPQIPLQSFA